MTRSVCDKADLIVQQPQVQSTSTKSRLQPRTQDGKQLQLRVVTPELAQAHIDINSIAPASKPLPLSTTLLELRVAVCQHLAVPGGDEPLQELDCNCSAARQIDGSAALNERGVGDSDALHTLIIVYEDNKVAVIPTQTPTLASIKRAAREQLQEKVAGKLLCAIGGLEDRNERNGSSTKYLRLPVLAVCSRQSHREKDDTDPAADGRGLTSDLHSSECPIDITMHNKDVTIEAAGLYNCAVDGVLTIFTVQRVCSTDSDRGSGTSIVC